MKLPNRCVFCRKLSDRNSLLLDDSHHAATPSRAGIKLDIQGFLTRKSAFLFLGLALALVGDPAASLAAGTETAPSGLNAVAFIQFDSVVFDFGKVDAG
jgi:hypothetical protein